MNQRYVFIDFEFTMPGGHGKFSGFIPEIIEVGLVAIDHEQQDHFSSYVKPTIFPELSDRCKSFLGISQQDVARGISFTELVAVLNKWEGATVITWGNMDMKVLRQNCQSANLAFPFKGQQIDLSLEYKRFFGDKNQTGLWKAVQQYGNSGTGKHHRALDDALTTFKIHQLLEKDKQYLNSHAPTTIGDLIDFEHILSKWAQ